jgi:NAD-dependent SIR2 family protein deacetylase
MVSALSVKGLIPKIKKSECENCGKETDDLTLLWIDPQDKRSRKLLCDECLKNPEINPRREWL